MNPTVSGTLPGIRLSRRATVGRLAGVGAAAIMTASLGISHGAAHGTSSFGQSSVATPKEGTIMTEATPASQKAPLTVVLVHGAWADGSSWAGVITALAGKGPTIVAPPNPLRGISEDAAYIASYVQQIKGPVLLVGHSYGGAVITNAALQAKNVVGLVYVAGFLTDQGETLQVLAAQAKDSLVGPALRPAQYPSENGGKPKTEFFLDPASFHAVFCPDVPDAQALVMATTHRPLSELAFSEPTQNPAWKKLRSWAIFGSADKVIGTTGLRAMAQRAGAETVEVPGASHVVMISQPAKVTDVILTAIDAVS